MISKQVDTLSKIHNSQLGNQYIDLPDLQTKFFSFVLMNPIKQHFIASTYSVLLLLWFGGVTCISGTSQYLLGSWDRCISNFQFEKSPVFRNNQKSRCHIRVENEKKLPSYLCFIEKSICPIAFCTGSNPNPPNKYWPVPQVQIYVGEDQNIYNIFQNQLSGYLLRKFKNSNGWQKLWVVFTNFCLFFYKTYQVGILIDYKTYQVGILIDYKTFQVGILIDYKTFQVGILLDYKKYQVGNEINKFGTCICHFFANKTSLF